MSLSRRTAPRTLKIDNVDALADTRPLAAARSSHKAASNAYAAELALTAATLIRRLWHTADLAVFSHEQGSNPDDWNTRLLYVQDSQGEPLWHNTDHPALADTDPRNLVSRLDQQTALAIEGLLGLAATVVLGFFPTHTEFGQIVYRIDITTALAG